MDEKVSDECNILAPSLCRLVNFDPYTIVLMMWAALQLTWVTMLLFVQLVQISRAMTTYENMRGSHHGHGHEGASTSGMAAAGHGPNTAVASLDSHGHNHHHKGGWFDQWKKILGVDTFVETAIGDKSQSRTRNPFSRGIVRNCKDFLCDSAPVFGNRENGAAMLDGQVVNYTSMYEAPSRMTTRTRRGEDSGGAYESVAADDAV